MKAKRNMRKKGVFLVFPAFLLLLMSIFLFVGTTYGKYSKEATMEFDEVVISLQTIESSTLK